LSLRLRISLLVAATALVAAGAVVGVTLATRQTPVQPQAQKGKPPLGRDLPTPAAARIRTAFDNWPKGGVTTMEELGREYPRDPVVQLYRGLALLWAGYAGDAEVVLQKAKKLGRDTTWEVQADSLLHPQFSAGYPIFEPLRRDPLLDRGFRLQAAGHQHSALRVYERAARKAPNDDATQVAAAVARFDKDNLTPAFSHLGPLTQRFPRSQIVRFYLGLLLAWTGERDAACVQFGKTVALGRSTQLGRQATTFVTRACKGGTRTPKK